MYKKNVDVGAEKRNDEDRTMKDGNINSAETRRPAVGTRWKNSPVNISRIIVCQTGTGRVEGDRGVTRG